jgi:hypothetical protein
VEQADLAGVAFLGAVALEECQDKETAAELHLATI